MPGIDGYEVCRRLKNDARTRDIPVIFLSALRDEADTLHGFELGAVDFIAKPYRPEEVLARVRTMPNYTDCKMASKSGSGSALANCWKLRLACSIRRAGCRN